MIYARILCIVNATWRTNRFIFASVHVYIKLIITNLVERTQTPPHDADPGAGNACAPSDKLGLLHLSELTKMNNLFMANFELNYLFMFTHEWRTY